MTLLTEIHRSPGINLHSRTIHRIAVRAVILRGRNLLMIYSTNRGDYKFPGGGVMEGESHAQALQREVQEECGTSLACIGEEIGVVIEYNHAVESDYDTFKMTSYYYRCDVKDGFGIQKLDEYERDLGFKPIWINIDDAIQLNKALLNSDNRPEWLKREIFMLEYIHRTLLACKT
jgi:8-oxo-dGTP pyrophosphatase MutT (NUDIX family)